MLINCAVCGRLFRQNIGEVCSRCLDEDSDYERIKKYLYNNRGASAVEISIATGVPVSTLLKLVNNEHLTIVDSNRNRYLDDLEANAHKAAVNTGVNTVGQSSIISNQQGNKFGQRARKR